MANFELALAKVLINEGGYVNDPDDTGGETYRGVARKMNSKWEGWEIIDLHKKASGFPKNLDNNQELQEKIALFYKINYWDRIKGDEIIDQEVAFSIFDFAVNAGAGTSSILAQKVIEVTTDGVIGKGSIEKLNAFNPEHFLAAFTVAKIARYISIVNKRPVSKKYFFTWVSRALHN